jgi:rhodanese-related sulfurtransferase
MTDHTPITPITPAPRRPTAHQWAIRGVIAAAIIAVVAYFALGMPGMDHGDGTQPHDMSNMQSAASGNEPSELAPSEFEDAVARPLGVVINVHVPYEGEIPGTDANVPYDAIENSAVLPSDGSEPILLYCKTGEMSRIAAETLASMGYTNVQVLAGGMDAWDESGRSLTSS